MMISFLISFDDFYGSVVTLVKGGGVDKPKEGRLGEFGTDRWDKKSPNIS